MNAEQKARQATHELQITEAEHAKFRDDCLAKAVELAKAGEADHAYRKLLMVVALDEVRAAVGRQKNDDILEKEAAKIRGESQT